MKEFADASIANLLLPSCSLPLAPTHNLGLHGRPVPEESCGSLRRNLFDLQALASECYRWLLLNGSALCLHGWSDHAVRCLESAHSGADTFDEEHDQRL